MERAVDADKIKLAEEITSKTVLQNKPDMIRRMLSLAEYYKGSMAYELFQTALDISTELANDHKRTSMIAASIAELYLSEPLCMKPDAKEKCKEFVGVCLSSDEKNVDGWSLKASYHISSEEMEEAKESLKRGLSLYSAFKKFGPTFYWAILKISIFWPKIILKISKNDQIEVVGPFFLTHCMMRSRNILKKVKK